MFPGPEESAVCVDHVCEAAVPFGGVCTRNEVCESGLCLDSGRCSKPCAGAADCPPAPEWTCASVANYPHDMCQCVPGGPEVCDGSDNDCSGDVDDGATCSEVGFTCQSGACACDPAGLCNGVCKDLASDVQNCGACGATCAVGAACFEGHCQTTLVTGQDVSDMAVDATHVYWTNDAPSTGGNNTVMKVSVDGGALTTLASGQIHPRNVVLDATHVYWTNNVPSDGAGTVMKVPLGGGASTTLAAGQESLFGLAVNATSVFWSYRGFPNSVRQMPLGGGAFVSSDMDQDGPQNMAADATGVYVVADGGMVIWVPLGGGVPTKLAPTDYSKSSRTHSIALDATHVYWTNDDTVMKLPLGGGATITLATGQVPGSLAVDGVNVYWVNSELAGSVRKMPVGGGAVTTLASAKFAGALALDATSVYWSTGDAIMKAPK